MLDCRDPAEEPAPAVPVQEPAAAPEAVVAPSPLDPAARSVLDLSRTVGNAAVARALDGRPADGRAGTKTTAAAALARARGGVAVAPATVAPELLVQPGDALEPALGAAVATRTPRAAVAREEVAVDESVAATAAEAAYDALDGLNDVEAFKAALRGHDADTRWAIRVAFQERYGETLGSYVLDQLSGEELVLAAALLEGPTELADHVALGLALIGTGTRDAEVWRLLEGATLEGRRTLEKRYNAAFGTTASTGALSMGSLHEDLRDDLGDEEAYRATTLLVRDLTPADRLYLASAGTTGTRDDEVIQIVQAAWADGPAGIAALYAGWKDVQALAMDEVPDLRTCLRAELSLESWGLVEAVLDAAEAIGTGEGGVPPGEQDPDTVARAQFDAAYKTYAAAAEGLGTNEEQAHQAIERMRTLIETRTAERGADDGLVGEWKGWLGGLDLEAELSGAQLQQARFERVAGLEDADELYIAMRDREEERAVEIVDKAWAAGTVDELTEKCRRERTIGDQVRPSFSMWETVKIGGPNSDRVNILVNTADDLVRRGAKRLRHEIKRGDAEEDLGGALAFLRLSAALQPAVVASYAALYLEVGDAAPNRAFCDHVADRYGDTPLVVDVRDLVDPVHHIADPRARLQEILERGRRRHELSQPGLFFSVPIAVPGFPAGTTIGDLMHAYDSASGEDVFAVSDESLARLEHLALHATDEELAAFAAERGLAPSPGGAQEALVTGEYERLQERLEDVDALVRMVTEAVATAVELGLSAAITIATGGAGAGLFVAALTSAVAGMLVREAALRDRYELTSKENAEKLAVVVAGAALGAFGGEILEGLGAAEKLKAMGRLGAFASDAAVEGFSQVGGALASAAFADKVPLSEDLAAGAVASLVAMLGAGTGGSLKVGLDDAARSSAERLRQRLVANLTQNLIGGAGEVGTDLAKTGTGNKTAVDILREAGLKAVAAVAASITTTIGEHGAEQVAQAADEPDDSGEAGAEAEGGEESEAERQEGEAERKRALDDLASDESGTPPPARPGHDTAHFPEGLVEYELHHSEAERSYAVSIAEQPKDEVGMWVNAATGEYVVVQGAERFVTATWKSDPAFANGRWELVKHYHPGDPSIARFPSRQDFRALRQQLVEQHTSGEAPTGYVRSTIDYVDEHGKPQQTTFGYDVENGYFVQFVGADGKQHSEPFRQEPWAERSEWELYLLGVWGVKLAPLPTGGTASDLGAEKKPRVTTPTPGHFADVDPARPPPAGFTFTDDGPTTDPDSGEISINTVVEWTGDQGQTVKGHVIRAYDPATGTFEMREAFLSGLPPMIKTGGVEMTPGGETHLATYLQERQMKLMGIGESSLKRVKMSSIENVRTICQVAAARREGKQPDEVVLQTHSVTYAKTVLVQSGHEVVAGTVSGGREAPLEEVLARYEAENPSLRADHDAWLAQYGVKRTDLVLVEFDIELETAPWPSGSGSGGGGQH